MKQATAELRNQLDSIKQIIGKEVEPPAVFQGVDGHGQVVIEPEGSGEIISIPARILEFFRTPARNYLLFGGRSSAKSWSMAYWLLSEGARKSERILCVREVQHSIERSSAQLLRDLAMRHKCFDGWSWNKSEFRHRNGSVITFVGLSNMSRENLRSFEGTTIVWAEEAHALAAESVRTLTPTIRRANSKLYFTYNPMVAPADPVEMILKDAPATVQLHVSYKDCEIFLSDVTRQMIEHDKAHNFPLYEHIWEGLPLAYSESRVFKNFVVQDFSYEELRKQWESEEAEKPLSSRDYIFSDDYAKLLRGRRRKKVVGLLYGCDWGFAQDPSAGVRMFYSPDGKRLYIEHEYYAIGTTIDNLPGELIRSLPGIEKTSQVRGDAARPELVRHVQQHGISGIKASRKWKGSIEDGIQHLQSLEQIIVHPRCENTVTELRVFSHKVDKHTSAILPELEETNNHLIDSIRYGCEDHIKPPGKYARLNVTYS